MRHLLLISWLLVLARPVLAAQTYAVRPDGTVTFKASTSGITRLSLTGDRIRRIVNEGSAFEMVKDEEIPEPSAGMGLLAVFAEIAGGGLALNELADTRAVIHRLLFPHRPARRPAVRRAVRDRDLREGGA